MSGKDVSKDVLKTVKNKTGKSVSAGDIQKLASGVNQSTLQSEAQLRQLIQQVAGLVGAKVSEDTVKEIVNAVKNSKLNPNNMESMMKMLLGKK